MEGNSKTIYLNIAVFQFLLHEHSLLNVVMILGVHDCLSTWLEEQSHNCTKKIDLNCCFIGFGLVGSLFHIPRRNNKNFIKTSKMTLYDVFNQTMKIRMGSLGKK